MNWKTWLTFDPYKKQRSLIKLNQSALCFQFFNNYFKVSYTVLICLKNSIVLFLGKRSQVLKSIIIRNTIEVMDYITFRQFPISLLQLFRCPQTYNNMSGELKQMNIFDYKWWWAKIGGRPWTYITRDLWVQVEYIFIVAFTTIGFFTGMFWSELRAWAMFHPILAFVVLLAYGSLWFILGHIFWGTKYVPGQTGNTTNVKFAWRHRK